MCNCQDDCPCCDVWRKIMQRVGSVITPQSHCWLGVHPVQSVSLFRSENRGKISDSVWKRKMQPYKVGNTNDLWWYIWKCIALMTFNDNDSLLCYVTQFKTLTININDFPPSVQHFKRNIQHSILHFDLNDINVKFVIIHRSSK